WETLMFGRPTAPTALPPSLGSEAFEHAGQVLLRTNGGPGLAAAITFGPYGGFHGHLDKLSFVWFGFGAELGVDPGRAASQAYRLPIHRDWYKATLSHNAVLVDRKPQEPAQGHLEWFGASERYAAALTRCSEAYPGVEHRRLLLLTPTYLLVFDRLDADEARRFDGVYHHRGAEALCDQVGRDAEPDDAFPGFEYIENAREGVTEDVVRVQFRGDPVTTYLTIAGEGNTKVLIGDGPGASVEDRVPLVLVTRSGEQVRFAAVLEPVREDRPQVSDLRVHERDSHVRMEIQRGDVEDVVLLEDGRLEVTSAGVTVLREGGGGDPQGTAKQG
ncbi:MAG: heparinase II/III family protein, partial [Gemmatimonadota bacterium]